MDDENQQQCFCLSKLPLYEIMGQDFNVWLRPRDNDNYYVEVELPEDNALYYDCTHRYAIESLVSFCRSVLFQYHYHESKKTA